MPGLLCYAVAWIFGIFVSGYLGSNILVFILAIILPGVTLLTYRLLIPQPNRALMTLVARALLCIICFSLGSSFYENYETRQMQKAANFCRQQPAALTGVVVSEVHTYNGTSYFDLKEENGLKISVKVRSQVPVLPGHRLTIDQPTLTPVNPENTRILATRKLMGNGTFLSAVFPYTPSLKVEGVANPLLYGGKLLRNATAECFQACFPENVAGFLTALVSSDKSSLPEELYDDFIATGTIHIVVVSGMHFNYLMGTLLWLLSFFCPSRRMRLTLSMVLLALFVCYTGATLPVLRSFLMLSVTFCCDWFYWKNQQKQLTLILMVGIFLWSAPTLIYHPSFLLSFGAALGLSLFSKSFERWLSPLRIPSLCSYLATYLSVQVFTLPVILFYFARMPLISVIANFLVGPLVAPVLLLGVLTLAVFKIPLISGLVIGTEQLLSSLFLWLIAQTAKLPLFLQIPFRESSFLLMLGSGILLAFGIHSKGELRRVGIASLCVTCLIFAMVFRTGFGWNEQVLVTFFGSSNTNSAAIITPDSRLVLYTNGNDLLYGKSSAAYRDYSQIELLILYDASNPEYVLDFVDTHKVKQVVIPAGYRRDFPEAPEITFLEQSVTTETDGLSISLHTDGKTLYEAQMIYLGHQLSFTQNASYLTEQLEAAPQKSWVFNFRRTSKAARELEAIPLRSQLFSKKQWHPDLRLCNNNSMIQADRYGIRVIGPAE